MEALSNSAMSARSTRQSCKHNVTSPAPAGYESSYFAWKLLLGEIKAHHTLPAPHSKRCGGQAQEGQEEGGEFWDRNCCRTTDDRFTEVGSPELVVGLNDRCCSRTIATEHRSIQAQVVLPKSVVSCVDHAVIVEITRNTRRACTPTNSPVVGQQGQVGRTHHTRAVEISFNPAARHTAEPMVGENCKVVRVNQTVSIGVARQRQVVGQLDGGACVANVTKTAIANVVTKRTVGVRSEIGQKKLFVVVDRVKGTNYTVGHQQ